ncbi:MAG: serine/threonine protein kinase [Magnetococcales bacterium]|nr:serine/threonine protein kinase [Magnetococcales bacterium]
MDTADDKTPYQNLTPDTILDAVESAGYVCNGSLFALNSYENRVYQIGIEGGQPLVVKFYRAGRWSDAAILEEHHFCQALQAAELPVIAPLADGANQTLYRHQGYRLALYPRQGGRAPELEHMANLEQLGRFMGRIHAVGALEPFAERLVLDVDRWGVVAVRQVLESGFMPAHLTESYKIITMAVLSTIREAFQQVSRLCNIRLHGDCHSGNMLWTPTGPYFVDFDDTCMGPAVQDFWMCLSGSRAEQAVQLSHLLKGYQMFYRFNRGELVLIEPLRTLRMMHHAAWIAQRWEDPAFPKAFPWFNGPRYWEEHLAALQEQAVLLQEPPLELVELY